MLMRHYTSRDATYLLCEYVRVIIENDPGGGSGSGDYKNDLYNTFIRPATDIAQTAVAGAKKITRKARDVLWVGLQTILTTLIPFYGYDYKSVFDKQKSDIEKINSQYKDVYARTNAALADKDTAALAFMLNPALFIAAKTIKSAPGVAKGAAAIATGGLVGAAAGGKKQHESLKDFYQQLIINEQEDNKHEEPRSEENMMAAAAEVCNNFINGIKTKIKAANDVKTADNMLDLLKGKLDEKELSKIKTEIGNLKKKPVTEQAEAEKEMINKFHEGQKSYFAKELQREIDKVVNDKTVKSMVKNPEELDLVKKYRAAIEEIMK